jgi:exopolysaccharide biosynthesis polyprenyl glycosylphosphotransferase
MNLTTKKNFDFDFDETNARKGIGREIKSIELLGVPVSSLAMAEVMDLIDLVIDKRRYIRITAVNASKLYQAGRNHRLRKILRASDLNIPEYAVIWGARQLGMFLPEHIGGIMLVRRLFEAGSQRGYKFYFLGAKKEIVGTMVNRLQKDYPGIEIAGYHDGYLNAESEGAVLHELKSKRPDILLVAMGTPRQEYWIDEHFEQLKIPVAIGVGGSFDVFAGLRRETPSAWRRGFEWIYRLAQDPLNADYWKRYLTTNPWFVFQIVKSKFMTTKRAPAKNKSRHSVLVVGTPQNALRILDSTNGLSGLHADIVGILPTNGDSFAITDRLTIFPSGTRLSDILHQHCVQEVIFAPDSHCLQSVQEMLKTCELEGVTSKVLLYPPAESSRGRQTEVINGVAGGFCLPGQHRAWGLFFKRCIDVAGSLFGLTLLSPLFLVIAAAIKLTSPGPVFYRWKVVGLHKRSIVSYKFRTMVQNADELKKSLMAQNEMDGCVFKMKDDPRVTRLGKFLRKYSLDELPQLWSVLKGDLSLVGPRPPLQSETAGFEDWHWRKLSVKPGLTCLWQINGRNAINNFDHWVKLDLQYIDNWSLWLDVKILLKTIPAVLRGSGV